MPSAYQKIVAILPLERLDRVERALQEIRVGGLSVSRVKGYGEYRDYFARNWLDEHARVEVLTSAHRTQEIVEAILESASTGTFGDGIVTVLPVDSVWRIRSRALAEPGEL